MRVRLTHLNLDTETSPPVHAPFFPKTIREAWWLILTDKQGQSDSRKLNIEAGIHAVERVTDSSITITHELRFMAPPRAGKYDMNLHVLSDCYMGLDEVIDVTFVVHPSSELPDYVPHPEDVELDNEPTLFEQVMAANVDDSSDEEEDAGPSKVLKSKKGAEDTDHDSD